MPVGTDTYESLVQFVERWGDYQGSEASEAQTFLNELFAAFGQDRKAVAAEFEDAHSSEGIMDLRWGSVCIFEMKAPKHTGKLVAHRKQALDYWHHADDVATGLAAPQYVVLCSFHEFEVWEPGQFPSQPRAQFTLQELPARRDALLWLAGHTPVFSETAQDLTTEAATIVARVHESLMDRRAAAPETIRDFVLQAVWAMFAEDLSLIPNHLLTKLLQQLQTDPTRYPAAELGTLFVRLNQPEWTTDEFDAVPYANGGLFERPAFVAVNADEIDLLLQANGYDWRQVDPTIFGSLMEGFLGQERRSELGAHFTAPADIQKVIGPTILSPWRARIEAVDNADEAVALAHRLAEFRVLDPACGCGNFLYMTLREVRALTRALHDKIASLRAAGGLEAGEPLPVFGLGNLYGIEKHEFVAKIARVTLWMGHKLVMDEYGPGPGETYLPLPNLRQIQAADALEVDWPEVDAVVGNPPFIGTKQMRERLTDEYVKSLVKTHKIGLPDYCVFWFRKAHHHLGPGQRAGLVATNSIRDSQNRKHSLDWLREQDGLIHNAVSSQVWSGDANVHVSIVNWIKEPPAHPEQFMLDGRPVPGITTTLEPGEDLPEAPKLAGNAGFQHAGVVPNPTDAFCISDAEAVALFARDDADYGAVVQRYLTGDDLLQTEHQGPTRWIINFRDWPLERAMEYPAALEIIRSRVKPIRDDHSKRELRDRWWQFSRTLAEMWRAIDPLERYVVCPATGKRILMCWGEPGWCPSNAVNVFPFDDDYAMGVLSSQWHLRWASQSAVASKLKSDQRYVSRSFHTFPWPPEPDEDAVEAVRDAAKTLIELRTNLCAVHHVGLTTLYNQVEDGAHRNLIAAHEALDSAVLSAYGWPTSESWPEVRARLYTLNATVTADPTIYRPFSAASTHAPPTLF